MRTGCKVSLQLASVCILLFVPYAMQAQQPAEQQNRQPTATTSMADAWGELLQNAVPQTAVDPALTVPQNPVRKESAGDFLNHFYLDTRTEYWRTHTAFTGTPTLTGVINVLPGTVANPNGIPDPSVFQPSTDQMYSFMNWGTRGWLSDRVNTNFSFRYAQDLSHVDQGSPALSILNTFDSNRELQLLSGYVEINGRPTDGFLSGTSLRFGRQYTYGAELAAFDGAAFSMERPRFSYTLYAGRRFTYYSDPDQRAIGGGNFLLRFGRSSVEYDGLFYVKGEHVFTFRSQFTNSWLFSTHFRMIGGAAIDYAADVLWTPSGGKTTFRFGFLEKITNHDYFYDYTILARDLDPHNPLQRLNLGPLSPHTQFVIDARRTLNSRVRLGGTLWVRRLNNSNDQSAFDTSFVDYRVSAQIYPGRRFELYTDYHERESDRLSPSSTALFDNISTTGETRSQDVSVQIGRSFAEGRASFKVGGFYRQLDLQDRFFLLNGVHGKGVLADASVKLDQRTRVYLNWDLDTDFPIFRPDIRNTQSLRLGVAWRY